MNRPLRVIISFAVAVIGFVVLVHALNLPPESYEPPPSLYKNATAQATGKITGTSEEGFSSHLLQGPAIFNYISYSFQPASRRIVTPNGTSEHKDYLVPIQGQVRVDSLDAPTIKVGNTVPVVFDPVDPKINGVPGSVGVWNRSASYLSPYLWWYVGILAVTLVLQELLRMVTRTNDFAA